MVTLWLIHFALQVFKDSNFLTKSVEDEALIVAEVCVQAYASFAEYIHRKLCILKCEVFDFQDIKTAT